MLPSRGVSVTSQEQGGEEVAGGNTKQRNGSSSLSSRSSFSPRSTTSPLLHRHQFLQLRFLLGAPNCTSRPRQPRRCPSPWLKSAPLVPGWVEEEIVVLRLSGGGVLLVARQGAHNFWDKYCVLPLTKCVSQCLAKKCIRLAQDIHAVVT